MVKHEIPGEDMFITYQCYPEDVDKRFEQAMIDEVVRVSTPFYPTTSYYDLLRVYQAR